jgi:acetyl-CoA synthetase
MIPELPIFMLACARIGAPHTVVFSGFSAQALADRINDLQAKVLVTADAGFRRGKHLELKNICDEALNLSTSIEKVVVARRAGIDINMKPGRDVWLHELLDDAASFVPAEPVEATHPLYIGYHRQAQGHCSRYRWLPCFH